MTPAASSATVWANLCRLLAEAGHGSGLSLDVVHKLIKGRVGRGQLQRLAAGDNVTLQTVDRLASAVGVPAWQLMQPQALQAGEPRPAYRVSNSAALVSAVQELVDRLPREHRIPAADVLVAWVRSGEDEGRSTALIAMIDSKQRAAA